MAKFKIRTAINGSRPVETERSRVGHSPSPWLTPVEAAIYLSVALGTLRNWTSARFIPFSKRGRVVRYNRETLDSWFRGGGCAGRATLPDARMSQS